MIGNAAMWVDQVPGGWMQAIPRGLIEVSAFWPEGYC